jgi:hypothetical protein
MVVGCRDGRMLFTVSPAEIFIARTSGSPQVRVFCSSHWSFKGGRMLCNHGADAERYLLPFKKECNNDQWHDWAT